MNTWPRSCMSMMIDRDSIESMLRQIQAGEISCEQATEVLVGKSDDASLQAITTRDPDPTATEAQSLAELIDRFGPPPQDLVDQWCETLSGWIPEEETNGPMDRRGDRFVVEDLEQIGVNSTGQLVRIRDSEGRVSPASQEWVRSFRTVLGIGEEALANSIQTNPRDGRPPERSSKNAKWKTRVIAAGFLLCCGMVALLIDRNASTPPLAAHSQGTSSHAKSSASKSNPFSDGASTGSKTEAKRLERWSRESTSPEGLERIEKRSDSETASLEGTGSTDFSVSFIDRIPSMERPPVVGFPVLSPSTAKRSTATTQGSTPSAESINQNDSLSAMLAASTLPGSRTEPASEDAMSELDSTSPSLVPPEFPQAKQPVAEPEELQQETQEVLETEDGHHAEATVRYHSLPRLKSADESLIDDRGIPDSTDLRIEFPTATEVALVSFGSEDDERSWQIMDTRRSIPLAMLRLTEDSLGFQWAPNAAKRPAAKSLLHGRLRWQSHDGSNRTLYLRPQVTAEPWGIRLDAPDMRPTWDLGWTLSPGGGSMSVEMDLPEDIELSWVEPLDSTKFRKQVGVMILKPIDGESVALRVGLDVRCTRKLSCRIRYAGRLDSTMPWHGVSRELLDQYADQVAHYSERIRREAERLQSVYDVVGSRGRRIIRIKQKRNDALADQVRELARRVADLRGLIGSLEAEAHIRFHLAVQWASGEEQVVFDMK